jgi:hypothetical protein
VTEWREIPRAQGKIFIRARHFSRNSFFINPIRQITDPLSGDFTADLTADFRPLDRGIPIGRQGRCQPIARPGGAGPRTPIVTPNITPNFGAEMAMLHFRPGWASLDRPFEEIPP